MNRRDFLKNGFAAFAAIELLSMSVLESKAEAAGISKNPLESYPDRDWEQIYRDIYKHDDEFVFVCTPNCTHNCMLKAYVKNGVITRAGPTQRYHEGTDLYGTKASQRWNPRHCNKGLAIVRRFSGDRRVKGAMVRRGFKEWVDRGFPRDELGLPLAELFKRGEDTYVQVPWHEAYQLAAVSMAHIAKHYSGERGAERLLKQDYHPDTVARVQGAGTRTFKFRGGMPVLGSIKLFGQYRQANSMALLDKWVRGVDEGDAKGAVGLDNYTWHTDLPPGHPMVTGQQTVDFDLCNVEYADVAVLWGMNWLCTKMPDAHFLTEAKLKGTRLVNITTEYNATSSKCDDVIILRPGTDPAFALGVAREIIEEGLYDREFVERWTDLPMLVRLDTQDLIRAKDCIPGYKNKKLVRTNIVDSEDLPEPFAVNVGAASITPEQRDDWGDFVIWDTKKNKPMGVSRDDVGNYAKKTKPALEGTYVVTIDGEDVECRPVFDLVRQHLKDTWTLEATEKVTWAPKESVQAMAKLWAANPEKTLFAVGMGPNQMFNADQKDRAIFLVAALTRNVGFFGGNVGSYAGNYRAAYFNGMPKYMAEDPFNIQLDPDGDVKVRKTFAMQSAHFYSHGDGPFEVHGAVYNGETHTPFPSKLFWFSGSNSILGNAKGHYDIVMNLLRHPKYRSPHVKKRMIEALFVNEWWWTGSCEYGDIIFGVDSWGEYNVHDITNSCTNPFMEVMPLSPIPRIHSTRSDTQTYAGVAAQLANITGDKRFNDYWHFIEKDKAKTYIQRVLDHCNISKGYEFDEMLQNCEKGIPHMMMGRTYPKFIGYEQSVESAPWYNRTGRLEFFRDEPEFKMHGEFLPLHREPIDATFHEPNAIVALPHPSINPKTPKDLGFSEDDLSGETRQVRNVVRTPDQLLKTRHPLMKKGFTHQWITPKYRHSVHTMFADIDVLSAMWAGFGDLYRRDKRKPWVGEACFDMNPEDGKALGIADGDYIWVDADPEDRPFHGWQDRPEEAKITRAMLRARYFPGTPKGIARTYFHFLAASFGTVKGAAERPDGQAKNSDTGYQAMYRFGSHQSGTRSWLRPTLLTDTLTRKDLMGQTVGQGFCPDVHCANGAPRESFVKLEKAESGGRDGQGEWRKFAKGGRPGTEDELMKKYLAGEFITKEE